MIANSGDESIRRSRTRNSGAVDIWSKKRLGRIFVLVELLLERVVAITQVSVNVGFTENVWSICSANKFLLNLRLLRFICLKVDSRAYFINRKISGVAPPLGK